MPLDPSISLGARAPSISDSLQPISSMLAINGAMSQQQMQQLAMQDYLQKQADTNALRGVFSNPSNLDESGRPNLDRITSQLFQAAPNSASGILDQLQKGQTHGVELQQKQFDLARARIGAMQGALSTLAQKPDLNQGDVIGVARQLIDGGMADQAGIARALSSMPTDPAGLRQWINQGLLSVQSAKDQLEAATPKVQLQDTGGQIVPYNTNPRAAAVGPMPGGALSKTLTPEQSAQQWREGTWVAPPSPGAIAPGGSFTPDGLAPPKGSNAEKAQKANTILPLLDDAEKLVQNATGSYAGAGYDILGRVAGVSTEGSRAIAKLKALEGALMMQMPRMEGPQSDKDVALYRASAGNIGDPTIPQDMKLAAIQTIRQIQQRYADQGATASGVPMAAQRANTGGATGSWGGDQPSVPQPVQQLRDGGAYLDVDGIRYPVVSRNQDGSTTMKDPKTGRTGTVRP